MKKNDENNILISTLLKAILLGSKIADEFVDNKILKYKGTLRDIVSQVDIDISNTLIKVLEKTEIPVISEEDLNLKNKSPQRFWIVDPIDGTVNFFNDMPMYTISGGLIENNDFVLGAVCAPAMNELFFTLNSDRAMLNGKPFEHEHKQYDESLVAASFPPMAGTIYYEFFKEINETTRGCLRLGSASLNICWAASGKLQVAYGFKAKLWDIAGAISVAKASGCEIYINRRSNPFIVDYIVGSSKTVEVITQKALKLGLFNNNG